MVAAIFTKLIKKEERLLREFGPENLALKIQKINAEPLSKAESDLVKSIEKSSKGRITYFTNLSSSADPENIPNLNNLLESTFRSWTKGMMELTFIFESRLFDMEERPPLESVLLLLEILSDPTEIVTCFNQFFPVQPEEGKTLVEQVLGSDLSGTLIWRRGAICYMFAQLNFSNPRFEDITKIIEKGVFEFDEMLGNTKFPTELGDQDEPFHPGDILHEMGMLSSVHMLGLMYTTELHYWGWKYGKLNAQKRLSMALGAEKFAKLFLHSASLIPNAWNTQKASEILQEISRIHDPSGYLRELISRQRVPLNPQEILKETMTLEYQGPSLEVVREKIQIQISDGTDGKNQSHVLLSLTRPSTSSSSSPSILLLHGTGASKDDHRQLLPIAFPLLEAGFEVVTFDSRYHGERTEGKTKEEKRRDYEDALVRAWRFGRRKGERDGEREGEREGVRQEYPFIYDTSWDISRILDFLDSRPSPSPLPRKYGITGISLGGMHSWLASVADERLHVVVPMIGVQNFRYALDQEQYQERVATLSRVFEVAALELKEEEALERKQAQSQEGERRGEGGEKELKSPAITPFVVRQVWEKIVPGLLDVLDAPFSLRSLAPRPLLILNGGLDGRCPREGVLEAFELVRKEYARVGQEANLEVFFAEGSGHMIVDEHIRLAVAWFKTHLVG